MYKNHSQNNGEIRLQYNCFSSSVVPDLSRQIAKASFHGVSFGF